MVAMSPEQMQANEAKVRDLTILTRDELTEG
jgi:hypothetical protein